MSEKEHPIFCTVVSGRKGFVVKYVSFGQRVCQYTGSFADSEEALACFIDAFGNGRQIYCYLDEQEFQKKARALAAVWRKRK